MAFYLALFLSIYLTSHSAFFQFRWCPRTAPWSWKEGRKEAEKEGELTAVTKSNNPHPARSGTLASSGKAPARKGKASSGHVLLPCGGSECTMLFQDLT